MNGTLDQLDAFFGSITSAWGRLILFFLTCTIGFALGILASGVRWSSVTGFEAVYFVENSESRVYLCIDTLSQVWGLVHALLILGIAYVVFVSEINLCQTLCVVFAIESWYWWFAADGAQEMLDAYQHGKFHIWFPFHAFMVLLSPAAIWIWWRSWRNNHPQVT